MAVLVSYDVLQYLMNFRNKTISISWTLDCFTFRLMEIRLSGYKFFSKKYESRFKFVLKITKAIMKLNKDSDN